jgi:hypothetical protein
MAPFFIEFVHTSMLIVTNTLLLSTSVLAKAYGGFMNKFIVNYVHMKIILALRFISNQQPYKLHLIIKALNYIVVYKEECAAESIIHDSFFFFLIVY